MHRTLRLTVAGLLAFGLTGCGSDNKTEIPKGTVPLQPPPIAAGGGGGPAKGAPAKGASKQNTPPTGTAD